MHFQIFFLFFVFPKFGVVLDAFTAGVLAIGIHYAAYCSEVYRAGFDNIHAKCTRACPSLASQRSGEFLRGYRRL